MTANNFNPQNLVAVPVNFDKFTSINLVGDQSQLFKGSTVIGPPTLLKIKAGAPARLVDLGSYGRS